MDGWRLLGREMSTADVDALPASPDRVQALLGADLLLLGEYHASTAGAGRLDVTLRLIDSRTGKERSRWVEVGPLSGLPAITARLGDHARAALAAPRPGSDREPESAEPMPRSLEATRLHAAGLLDLARSEYSSGIRDLEAALALDGGWTQAELDLADAYWELGEARLAREHAGHALEKVQPGMARLHLEAELRSATYAELPGKAAEAARRLLQLSPDEPSSVLAVAMRDPPQAVLVTIDRARASDRALVGAPWLDLLEGQVQRKAGNEVAAERLFEAARERAERLGAIRLLARVRLEQGKLARHRNRLSEVMERFTQSRAAAVTISDAPGAIEAVLNIATVERDRAELRASEQHFEEALAGARRIGSRSLLHDVLVELGGQLYQQGRFDEATSTLQQAIDQRRLADEPPRSDELVQLALLAIERTDGAEARRQIQESAAAAVREGTPPVPFSEELLLVQQDHLREARAMYQRLAHETSSDYQHLDVVEARARVGHLDCELGQPRQGLAEISETLSEERGSSLFGAFNRALMGSCLLQLREFAEAEHVAREGLVTSERAGLFYWRLINGANLARAEAGLGHPKEAIRSLNRLLAEARANHGGTTELEMSLALGIVERGAGLSAGTQRLLALEARARSRGWFRIARHAREALAAKMSPPEPGHASLSRLPGR